MPEQGKVFLNIDCQCVEMPKFKVGNIRVCYCRNMGI